MEKQKFPSKKELEKLYHEKGKNALLWYTWRNALRGLSDLGYISFEGMWGEKFIKHLFAIIRINVLLSQGGDLPKQAILACEDAILANVATSTSSNALAATNAAIIIVKNITSSDFMVAAAFNAAEASINTISDLSTSSSDYSARRYRVRKTVEAIEADYQQLEKNDGNLRGWPLIPIGTFNAVRPARSGYESKILEKLEGLQLGFLAEDIETLWKGEAIVPNRLQNYMEEFDESTLNDPNVLRKIIVGGVKSQSKFGMAQNQKDEGHWSNVLSEYSEFSIKPERIWGEDFLGRDRLVNALAKLLTHPEQKTPLTIGLLGDWGAGKSTTIELLQKKLDANKAVNYKTQIFNAWSYEHTGNIQAGIAQEAITGLVSRTEGVWSKFKLAWKLNTKLNKFRLYFTSVSLLLWFAVIVYLTLAGRMSTVWEIGIGTTLSILFFIHAIKPLLAHPFAKELHTYLNLPDYSKSMGQLPVFQKHVSTLAELCLKGNKRLLFVVDDLDRCSPEGIVKVFEAVRLVMELKRVVVIIAIDHHIALAALAHHYQELVFDGKDSDQTAANRFCNKYEIARDYLGKIIQLPINLDKPGERAVNSYIDHLFDGILLETSDSEKQLNIEQPQAIDLTTASSGVDKKETSDAKQDVLTQMDVDHSIEVSMKDRKTVRVNIDDRDDQEKDATMLHSHEEQTHFQLLARLFAFHNPRQLKRLHSSYRLLRAYRDEDETQNLENMSLLFWLEFKYSHGQSESDKKTEELKSHDLFKELLANDQKFKKLEKLVDSFVLPRA